MPSYFKRRSPLYNPKGETAYRISRSKIELFIECPRCFYLDRRLGVGRPSTPPFTLNNAVDHLLKNEFDLLRKNGEAHALMKQYKIDAVPYKHEKLSEWRDDMRRYIGATHIHPGTNLEVCGIVDDIWVNKKEELIIVDYKATSTTKTISLDDQWKLAYKRQMEMYQWIFRQNGFKVAPVGYFVFANAKKDGAKFDGKLEFDLSIIPYEGHGDWIEGVLQNIKDCLDSEKIPQAKFSCEYCKYRREAGVKVNAQLL